MAPNLREGNENAVREAEDQEQIRLLLDDHIRAVTALIRRLNRDIQVGYGYLVPYLPGFYLHLSLGRIRC